MDGKRVVNWKGIKALGVVYSKTQITRKEQAATFPRSFKLDNYRNSPRVWWEHEVIKWLEDRATTIVVPNESAAAEVAVELYRQWKKEQGLD